MITVEAGSPLGSIGEYRKLPKAKHVKPPANLKFACPFYKNDPTRFTPSRACPGPGFSSISRVKEHLYRAHKQPDYQCIRCYSTFMSRDLLEEHQRAATPCKVSVDNTANGINEAQCIQLRKKPNGQKTDVERWEEIYRITFPKASIIPSCYYEFQDVAASASKAYALGLRQVGTALVAGIRRDLENHFDELGNDFKASFLLVVKNRVETTVEELLRKNETILTDMSGFTTQANSPLDATPGSPILTLDAGFTDVDLKDIEFRNIYFTWDSQLMLNNGPTDWLQESPDSSSSMQM